jgi:hypothetical protein
LVKRVHLYAGGLAQFVQLYPRAQQVVTDVAVLVLEQEPVAGNELVVVMDGDLQGFFS